jgi:hypothetical protein
MIVVKTNEERLQELLELAHRQGHLTYDDINAVAPDTECIPEDLDEISAGIREAGVEIIEKLPSPGWQARN